MGLFNLFKNKNVETEDSFMYSEEEFSIFKEFIKDQYGDFDKIITELIPSDLGVDIIVVPPTKENNYYKLVTMGMATKKMIIPTQLKSHKLERAELVMYLPPTWNMDSDKEEDTWPIREIKFLAGFPFQYNTWLGIGHSLPSDSEYTHYASNTKFCGMMLVNALNKNFDSLQLNMKTKGKINFYQLCPLYKEEIDFKLQNDGNDLIDLFEGEDILPIININRKNYCEK